MARATTKVDLITSANGQFEKMWKLIDSMSKELQTATFAEKMAAMGKEAHWSRDKNLRDVLVHLYEWHQLLLNWINSNREGECKSFLPEPYNWKTYPVMNVEFWKKHQNTLLSDAKAMLKESHQQVMELIATSLTTNSLTRVYSIGQAPLRLVLIVFQQLQAIMIGR